MKIIYMGMCTCGFPMRQNDALKSLQTDFMNTFEGMQYLENWIQVMECLRSLLETKAADSETLPAQIADFLWKDISYFAEMSERREAFHSILNESLDGKLRVALECDPLKGKDARVADQLKVFFGKIAHEIDASTNILSSGKFDSKNYVQVEEIVCFFRQRAWLLWLQNFYATIIEQKLAEGVKGADINHALILVVLPEFSILDYPLAFNTTKMFVLRTLSSEWDASGQSIPWVFKEEAAPRLLSFRDLTKAYPTLLLIPGTAVWKSQNGTTRKFYNTLMVYRGGDVIYVWDKQMISGEDGICNSHKPRHIEFPYDKQKGCALFGSSLAADFLSRIEQEAWSGYGPTFQVKVCGKTIKFGVMVCLDASRPDFFAFDRFEGAVDFLIVTACGASMMGVLCEKGEDGGTRMLAKQGLFYCDARTQDAVYMEIWNNINSSSAVWYFARRDYVEIDPKVKNDPEKLEKKEAERAEKVATFIQNQQKAFMDINTNDSIQLYCWPEPIEF